MQFFFIIIVENIYKRTQEETNKEFGMDPTCGNKRPIWEIFTFKGKSYAELLLSPRYFNIRKSKKKWEGLRKFLVHAKKFFGGNVRMGNDITWFGLPKEEDALYNEDFYLPPLVDEKDLKEPDYEKFPNLKNIKELEGLIF